MIFGQYSAGTRSLIALGVIGTVSAAAVLMLRPQATTSTSDLPEQPNISLASLPIAQDIFGTARPTQSIETTLQRRETLSGLMDRLDVNRRDGALALSSLTEPGYLDARRVRSGLKVTAYMDGDALSAFAVEPEAGRRLLTKREADGRFYAAELKSKLINEPIVVKGSITTSLYEDARVLGAADQQVVDFAQVFAYDVDFQREVHPGDKFEMVFESLSDERGNIIRRGDVLYASLNGKAVDKGFYRFTTPDEGATDYFQGNGESATRFLMKTPINGARLSSSFGRRRHPISGYSRLHKGTDFAAPSGTPIYAAGHGTVERASRYGGYGKYVRVRHANGYKTAYAHMSRYGPGVKSGRRIRQGDIVGYVGSTGASTGPHLHYEVYINGKPVNAMALKLPTGRKLANTPEIMTAFEARRDEIDLFREIENGGDLMITAANSPAP
jgi:murein DD-endopeptidase MepM/ murein hydrolase activator NlpD